MKENDQSRFIRWGIPGWTMFLAFASFVFLDIVLSPASSKNSLINIIKITTSMFSVSITASAAAVLLVAAAGIPLGFVIYQVYFYIRWNSPFARDGLFPPLIVGRSDDLTRTMDGIDLKNITGNDEWRKKWTNAPLYNADHGRRWRYIENFFTEITQYMDTKLGGLSLFVRYRYLVDLLHTLGAGLFGIYLGYLGYVLLKVKTDDVSLSLILILSFISLAILAMWLEMEDKTKRENVETAPDDAFRYFAVRPIKRLGFFQLSNPSALYLLFLFSILYLGSPSPYTIAYAQSHLTFRLVVLGFAVFIWGFSKKTYPAKVIWSDLITLFALEVLAYFVAEKINNLSGFRIEWWNIGWVDFFFLVTNLIFAKNRQNTRDDLIAMQNYTMQRYFTNSIKPFRVPQHKRRMLIPKQKRTTSKKRQAIRRR